MDIQLNSKEIEQTILLTSLQIGSNHNGKFELCKND